MRNIKRISKAMISIVLCLSLIVCASPLISANDDKPFTRLVSLDSLESQYLVPDETAESEYPNGAVFFPVTSGELNMEELYAVDILRQGGTAGEASITVKTIDLTACYGEHYEIFTSSKRFESAVDGTANPYYAVSEYSFIPVVTETEIVYETDNNSEETQQLREDASELNDSNLEYMPISSEFTVNFADREAVKTIYIQTLKSDTVTDNLEFMLTLSNPKNCSISTTTTASYTIKEEREKPDTYIRITDETVNPESKTAYVKVQRTGNLGGFDSFRVKTQSGSAKAEESYGAVALNLTFTPGMTEIKVPVDILSKAQSGQKFNVVLSDINSDIIVDDSSATVTFDDSVDVETQAVTAFSQSNLITSSTVISSSERGKEIVNLSSFKKSMSIGDDYSVTADSTQLHLKYSNGMSCKNHAVSAVSNEKINFTGVDSITLWYNHDGGSCAWDFASVYVGDSDLLSDKKADCGWMSNGTISGRGTYWDMTNISYSHISNTFTLDSTKTNGEHYLYYTMQKGAFWGSCGVKFFNEGASSEYNTYLNLTPYTLSIIESPKVKLYQNGELKEVKLASNSQMLDPASSSSSSTNMKTSFKIYRNESTTISSAIDDKFNGLVQFKGVYFCDPDKTSSHSELVSLDSSVFTLTPEYLQKFSSYIKNKNIVIQPVYEVSKSNVTVESFSDNTTGISFKADNTNCTGTAMLNGETIGTISWTKSERTNGEYYVGDELVFNFTPSDGDYKKMWSASYDTRSASTKDLLSSATKINYDTGTDTAILMSKDVYYSITPVFRYKDASTKLVVTNPDNGEFSGKGEKYTVANADGSQTVSGYKNSDDSYTVFSDKSVSSILTFYAQPESGYRAKWEYRDSATHQTKTYYGKSFFYSVQNPYYDDDNHITLTFEKITGEVYSKYITGTTQVQEGTILNPPLGDTEIYDVAPNTLLTFEQYTTMSDGSGNFSLSEDPNAEIQTAVKVDFCSDEVHRVLAFRNDQYYICDVDMSQYCNSDESTANIEVKLPYKTYGVTPTSITAIDSDNYTYNDTITLVAAKSVRFDLEFSRVGEQEDKPVNMVRWTVESDDGIEQTFDVEIEENAYSSHWANVISEIINPGESLYVELFNKSYDQDANAVYSSYGKFDTGYTFIATSIEETITYMPEIGVDSAASTGFEVMTAENGSVETIATPIPCIGPISPTVSIKGFTPIINMGSTGLQDEQGHDINTITIGIQFGLLKDKMKDNSKYASVGPLQKAKMLSDKLGDLDEINNSAEGFKPFGGGSALKMKTAVKLSFSVTFCYQGNYYVDNDTGEWCFTSSIFIVGAGGSVRVSIPFVVLYIPCFVYFTAEINAAVYMGVFPKEPADGSQSTYLTLTQLESKDKSTFQGVYDLTIKLGLGLGVGYDGILSASGNLTAKFDIQFNNFLTGYGTFGLTGGVTLELLFLKASWNGNIVSAELFNTLEGGTEAQMLNALNEAVNEEDILNNLSVKDLVINKAGTITPTAQNDLLKSAIQTNEKVLNTTQTVVDPAMIEISDGVYFIASVMNCNEYENSILHYYIYDSNTDKVTESEEVLNKLLLDMNPTNSGVSVEHIKNSVDTIDHDVMLTDCGDDILLTWNKSSCTEDETDSLKLINSVSVASVLYNKTTGKFHDYNIIPVEEDKIYFSPKAAYNENTGVVQMFYQQMDLSEVTADTTLNELSNMPSTLMTSYCYTDDADYNWSTPSKVAFNNTMLQYYDVIAYGDSVMLSYVASDTTGFVLENFDEEEYDPTLIDAESFGTENALYIQQFTVNGNDAIVSDKAIQIADTQYVSANPEFVHIKTDDIDNTLLFYKCNGKYAYQNIDTLLSQAVYEDVDGNKKVSEDYMEPVFITSDEDHTVNDDFEVYYNEDGTIYALWTTSEGEQQQIWARHFYIDSVITVTEVPQRDNNGNALYDDSGNILTQPLDEPVKLLSGIWGTKNYLTTDGIGGSTDMGMFKSNFTAEILDNGEILTAYDVCDYDYTDEATMMINNHFVIAEYDPSATYKMPSVEEHMAFSDEYPNGGETITVTMNAKNTGVKTGRDVLFTLYVNDEVYAEKTVPTWYADEQQLVTAEYTLPDGVKADDVSMYFTISENGNVKATSDKYSLKNDSHIIMTNASILPIQYVTDEKAEAKFYVTVDVYNTGNADYRGGDVLKFVDSDLYAQTAVVDKDIECTSPLYTSYGSQTLPEIAVGDTVKVKLVSDSIPASVFEKNAGGESANLEFVISPKEQSDWTILNQDDIYSFIDEFNCGMTQIPTAEKVKSLKLSSIIVPMGETSLMSYSASPAKSLLNADVEFTSSDESVCTVDKYGMVTGVSTGTATITMKADDIETSATVTVTEEIPLIGDVNFDGTVNIEDATLIQKYIVDLTVFTDVQLIVGDTNGDGRISVMDATQIQKYLAGDIKVLG